MAEQPFSAAVDVRGGGPGTRETDMLSLENSVGRADAIVLSGGSAFGLDASAEIQDLLRQDGKGYKLGKAIIPLVPAAVIFDLNIHDNPHVNKIGEQSPWRKLANEAYKNLNLDLTRILWCGLWSNNCNFKGWSRSLHHGYKIFKCRSIFCWSINNQ